MKRIRKILGLLLFAGLIGSTQACIEGPTEPKGGPSEEGPTCYWVDGTLYCDD